MQVIFAKIIDNIIKKLGTMYNICFISFETH